MNYEKQSSHKSYFAADKISKTWTSQIPRFNPLKSTLCAPWNLNFKKCWNWFLGICMKNVLVQFWRRYIILRLRKSQKHECHRYPVLTLLINILQKPFLSTLYTLIRTYPQNFMSLTLIVRTSICAPWNSNFEKCRNLFLGISMMNDLVQFRRRYLILRTRKSQNH